MATTNTPKAADTAQTSALPDALRCKPPRLGETVVHLDFGLCRLGKTKVMELSDRTLRTIALHFKDGDVRHVPQTDAHRIWTYGAELPDSALDSIGMDDWAEQQASRLAELRRGFARIDNHASLRRGRKGYGIAIDADTLDVAASGFSHELTACQSRAVDDLMFDLADPRPMNRLLIGDVGCGKTEVAVRAALAVALSGRQVRFAAPTRILARQHFEEIDRRAAKIGLRAGLFSGDLSAKEKRTVQAEMKRGEIDVLVGTHGILTGEMSPERPSFDIIDEEQKFGRKLKKSGYAADRAGNLLRLSATPIPKSVAEARMGLADISLIETYPKGRGKTDSATLPDTDSAVRKFVMQELSRDGQVIILCPRIRDLKTVRARMKALMPEARLDRIHGRRKPKANRRALRRFARGQSQILLSTTMLETGINVANANAMLVFRPDRFGLAQLHQLRGRIGRSTRDARFGMVLCNEIADTEEFARRMEVILDLQRRGDGLQLALRDSFLRGTGRIDSDDQTGHASKVGIELFEYLLGLPDDVAEAPFSAIPKMVGDTDWGLCDCADTTFSEARGTLSGAAANTLYGEALAACRTLPAIRVGASDDGLTFVRATGEPLRCDAAPEAVRALADAHS